MKRYMKPSCEVMNLKLEQMMETSVKGLDGVSVSKEEFSGGSVESKQRDAWSDDGGLW